MYGGGDRRAVGIAMLVLLAAMSAFAFLCMPTTLPPQQIPVPVKLQMEELPERVRHALTTRPFRAYANLGKRLPVHGQAYYLEHRIADAEPNERVVRGEADEVFYTRDNFHSVFLVK